MVPGSSVNKSREQQEQINQKIESLVSRYRDLKKSKGPKEMHELSEANVRSDFIDPLFETLGWDISKPDEYDREYSIKHGGRADIALKINEKPVIFIEAKRFGGIPHINERGDGDWLLEERQAILYAAKEGAKWAILTNFEKFRVFNARTGMTILDIESIYDYTDKIGKLLYLTKDAVVTGKIEKLAAWEERPDIDLEFLELLKNWRITLANDIYERNRDNEVLKGEEGELDLERLKDAVQRILDRLIIVRWAEDNLVLEDPNILQRKYNDWELSPTYNSIVDSLFADRALFDKFNDIHDGKIFERGHICEQIKVGDETLGAIIVAMNRISFRKFDFDILGNTYETYLGHTLYFKDDGTLDLKPSQGTRKESGIYYTPPYVVDYIVRNTLGELLKDKTPEEVETIRVLDPACGSGSFLIKAFDYFKDYYEKENERIRAEKDDKIREYIKSSGNQLKFDEMNGLECSEHRDVEKKILKNNIFGVDLDRQAAEIASVNLMLKALKPREKLPLILDENIRVGNSLISGTKEELMEYFGDGWEDKKPFNWGEAFGGGGFDVVVGNPPYGIVFGEDQKAFIEDCYPTFRRNNDIFVAFIEKGITLLKTGCLFSFIVPNTFLIGPYFNKLKECILNTTKILKILDFGINQVFNDPNVFNAIIVLQKEENKDQRENNIVELIDVLSDGELTETNFRISRMKQSMITDYHWKIIDNIVEKVSRINPKLGDIAFVKDVGLNYWTKGRGKKRGGSIGSRILYAGQQQDGEDIPYLKGRNIDRYWYKFDNHWLKHDYESHLDPEVDIFRYSPEYLEKDAKIIYRQTSDKIIATTDEHQYYLDKSVHLIVLREDCERKFNLKYVLTILNSKLATYFYRGVAKEVGRTFAQVKTFNVKRIPIYSATPSQQKPLIELADRMLSLNKELNTINTDFDRYLNLYPRIKDATLKDYIDKLPVSDKEVLKDHYGRAINRIEGKIKVFEIVEEGDWLVFKVGYISRTSKGKETLIKNVRAFRCRIEDVNLKKFLYYSIKEYTTPGKVGKGNIYDLILKIKVPRFNAREVENMKVIDEVMSAYLVEVEKREKVEREIDETDREIDRMVYELYGLSRDEIRVVEG